MKYQQPYGVTDPQAPYINGNPAAGIEGSIPPAAAFEEPMREIVNFISASGYTPSGGNWIAGGDLKQLAKSVQAQVVNYGVDNGTQNAMIIALNPTLAGAAYFPGLIARVKVKYTNINDSTHTTLTLDAGAGAAPVVRSDGSLPVSGDLPAGAITTFVFDGTRWQIANFLGGGGGGPGSTFLVKIPYCVDTGTPNSIVANFTPALTTPNAGDVILVKIANTNNAPTTIVINGLPSKNVVRNDGNTTPLGQSDVVAGAVVFLVYDGVQWLLVAGRYTFHVPSKIIQFLSTQNWTVPNGVYRVRCKVWGGGGGGAGTISGMSAGAGGAGGGYSERICEVLPGQVIPITVGGGGAGAAFGTGTGPTKAGPSGGTSSFGGYATATGGAGGSDQSGPYGPIGNGGGVGTGGDVNLMGEFGVAPIMTTTYQAGGKGGMGAGGGGAGGGSSSGGPSQTALVPGGGGEGCPNAYPGPGSPGVAGMIVVEY